MLLAALALAAAAPAAAQQPNLLFVLTDDQRQDTLAVMPATRANFDVAFRGAVVTTPNCCPSRASILTGEYAHTHGVLHNWDGDIFAQRDVDSLGPWLRERGYLTGFVGKYLNRYRLDAPVPPGWDEFHARVWDETGALIGEGHTTFALRHYEPAAAAARGGGSDSVAVYSPETTPGVYATRLFAELGARFIRRAHDPAFNPDGKPWALFVWPTAPHAPFIVEPRYADAPVPVWKRPRSFRERDMRDKPWEVRRSPMRRGGGFSFSRERAGSLRMLMSVDDLVERVWNTIDDHGERESTWGLFTSDNGYSWGEHHLTKKLHAYEESSRVPFRLAVPGYGPSVNRSAVVANIDVAPTLLEIAGAEPRERSGVSLVSLALGDPGAPCLCRRSVLLENWEAVEYQGLRSRSWKYVRWPSGREELYNLRRDPHELTNRAGRRGQAWRLSQARTTLARLTGG